MNIWNSIQKLSKDRFEIVASASTSLAKELENVAEGSQSFSKKSIENTQALVHKLLSVKTMDEAIDAHSEYLSATRRDFMDQANKFAEIYVNFAKKIVGPLENPATKAQNAQNEAFGKSKAA